MFWSVCCFAGTYRPKSGGGWIEKVPLRPRIFPPRDGGPSQERLASFQMGPLGNASEVSSREPSRHCAVLQEKDILIVPEDEWALGLLRPPGPAKYKASPLIYRPPRWSSRKLYPNKIHVLPDTVQMIPSRTQVRKSSTCWLK